MKHTILILLSTLFSLTCNAMFSLDYDITIGSYNLAIVEKVKIEASQELLTNTCTITLPGMVAGRALQFEDKIKRGDAATVRLGYNGDLKTEFTGYLKAIYPDSPMRLEFEDSAYLLRRPVKDKVLKNTNVKAIIQYVLKEVNPQISAPFKIVSDLAPTSYVWESFTIHNATGFEVLDKLRQESGLMIYAKGNELHYHLAFTQSQGNAIYDFSENIEATTNLKFVSGDDVKTSVVIVGRTPKGAKVEGMAGESGGDVITLQRPTVSDKKTLENIAREELKKVKYDGYRGEIEGWLVPYCAPGYAATIRDADYPARAGKYYVTAVATEFSQNGGIRIVSIGAKLSA